MTNWSAYDARVISATESKIWSLKPSATNGLDRGASHYWALKESVDPGYRPSVVYGLYPHHKPELLATVHLEFHLTTSGNSFDTQATCTIEGTAKDRFACFTAPDGQSIQIGPRRPPKSL